MAANLFSIFVSATVTDTATRHARTSVGKHTKKVGTVRWNLYLRYLSVVSSTKVPYLDCRAPDPVLVTNTRHRGHGYCVSAAYLSLRLYSSLFRPRCRLVRLYRNDFDGRELSTRRTGSSCRHWSCLVEGFLLGGFAYGSFQNYVFWRKILY